MVIEAGSSDFLHEHLGTQEKLKEVSDSGHCGDLKHGLVVGDDELNQENVGSDDCLVVDEL